MAIELKCIGCRHKQTDVETKLKSVGLWLCNRCGSVCEIVKVSGSKKRYEMTDDERRQEAELERQMLHGD